MSVRRGQASFELNRVVELNENIKEITRGAFELRLHAMNAQVTSRAHGREAPGFEVVAEHMGKLSRQLDEAMAEVAPAVEGWVAAASALLNLERVAEVGRRAAAADESGLARGFLLPSAARRMGAKVAELVRLQKVLVSELDDVARLTAGGCAMARSARLEAAYGREHRGKLSEVAMSFSRLADRVYELVLKLRRRASEAVDQEGTT